LAETKYGKYIIREPLEKGRVAPSLHICAEDDCAGAKFPNFPIECQLLCITKPATMISEPHAHDVDEIFFLFGGNPMNYFDFGAEIEIFLGEEGESHIINTTSIIYVPKGLIHCPVIIRRVDKPIQWMHIMLAPRYSVSIGDISLHPLHSSRQYYSPEEIIKLRGGTPEGK
jgi:hypothetical protein